MAHDLPRTAYLAIGLLGTSRPFTVLHRALYRRFRGRGILRHGLGCDAILLTTRGRRSGRHRTTPLFAFPIDGPAVAARRWVVVASNAGRHRSPAWYLNLTTEPSVDVQLGDRRWPALARVATGDEHDRLWAAALAVYPGYEIYRRRTRRSIPVVVLEPR